MNASNHLSNATFQLIEVFEQRSTKFIVTEYYDEDLSIALNKTENGFDINVVKGIINYINQILNYFRNNNVVFNNIKLENILVVRKEDNSTMIKLSDFSKAKLITNDTNSNKKNEWDITPVFGDINEEKQDLYDIGKEMYRMLFKKTGKKNEEMIKEIEKLNNTDLSDLMGKLLVEDVKERISWDVYYNHPFFYL